jgi:hypothetical protein
MGVPPWLTLDASLAALREVIALLLRSGGGTRHGTLLFEAQLLVVALLRRQRLERVARHHAFALGCSGGAALERVR